MTQDTITRGPDAAQAPGSGEEVTFVARQPIFDARKEVFGYKILYRSGSVNIFLHSDGDQCSRNLLDHLVYTFDLNSLVGDARIFVILTPALVIEGAYDVLPADRTVIELGGKIEPGDELLAACGAMKKKGFELAVDSSILGPGADPWAALADYVKVDFQDGSPEAHQALAQRFSPTPTPSKTRLIAMKVESHEHFKEARDAGYALFHGYFFCRPEMVGHREIPANKRQAISFIQEVNRPDIDFDRLEQVIRQEVALSVKLLRYLNSPAVGLRHKITSIKHALTMLGERPLKKWASSMALCALGKDKPRELVHTSLVHARFCEEFGRKVGMPEREFDLFLMGTLSVLDALLDTSLEEALKHMPVHEDAKGALLGQETPLSDVYRMMIAQERGDWTMLCKLASTLQRDPADATKIYVDAIGWANRALAA